MIVPGNNILSTALLVIRQQCFQYYAFASRSVQPNGQYLANYSPPVPMQGSMQAVPRNLYQEYGLDFDKYYQKFYVSDSIMDVDRDVSGDLFRFGNANYPVPSDHTLVRRRWLGRSACRAHRQFPTGDRHRRAGRGNYNTSSNLPFSVAFNQPVNVTGMPYIALSPVSGVIGGNATYTAGSGSTTLDFSYTVADTDTAIGIVAASPIQGAIANNAGIPANASFPVPLLTGITLNG